MLDSLYLGESPADEDCAQVGSFDYSTRATKECRALINQLRRICGEEIGSAQLKIKRGQHDAGPIMHVECYYSDNDEEGMDYAFKCESEFPEKWDADAKAELGL